jgi:hypothetical protein
MLVVSKVEIYMKPRRNDSSASTSHAPIGQATSLGERPNRGILGIILVVLLIITSVLGSTYLISRLLSSNADGAAIKSQQYQALFLTNGQVYFGHLSGVNNSYVHLTDIYYVQVPQSSSTSGTSSQSQQPTLVKLGNELHGPEDNMYVSRSQVLFWENLKNSGKVVQTILKYQAAGQGQ